MRCVLSFPGVMAHAQEAALALREAGVLERFVVSFGYTGRGPLAVLHDHTPGRLGQRLRAELGRRAILPQLADRTTTYGGLEILRTIAARAGLGAIPIDRLWDMGAHRFDALVASRQAPNCDVIVAFEYTARASFERAADLGRARVLHMPSLDSLAFKTIEDREKEQWPELRGANDAYFDAVFEERYARRQAEVALADVILANSSLTKRSLVAAGADGGKIFVAPLGAPAPVAEAGSGSPSDQPLRVLWSGPLSIRKGAHYLLEAWRDLKPGGAAALKVYGQVAAPERLLREYLSPGVELMGSVPRDAMLQAFADADVLVFPTLSDGFGMAITEALSRGVPVITTDQAGAADLITPGVNGLIIPAADSAALRQALAWCLDNRQALRDMRPHALEAARRHQWSDYRRTVMTAMDAGLRHAGYAPDFAGVSPTEPLGG